MGRTPGCCEIIDFRPVLHSPTRSKHWMAKMVWPIISHLPWSARDALVPHLFPRMRLPIPRSRPGGRLRTTASALRVMQGLRWGQRYAASGLGGTPNGAVRRLVWRAHSCGPYRDFRTLDVVEIGLSHGSGSTADGRASARLGPAERAPHNRPAGCQPAPQSSGAAAKGEGCLRVRGERDGLCETSAGTSPGVAD